MGERIYLATSEGEEGRLRISSPSFKNPYEEGGLSAAGLYIGLANVENPETNHQGIYVQHRVKGNLKGQVQDAIIAELRLNEASNGAQGSNCLEASIVVTGGVNALEHLNGVDANFHTEGTPTGTIEQVALLRATQVAGKAAGLTIKMLCGLHLDKQTEGEINYTIHAPEGESVIGKLTCQAKAEKILVLRGLTGQEGQALTVENSLNTTMIALLANGTGGVGGQLFGASWWINNNNAEAGTRALQLKGHSGQTANMIQVEDSEAHIHFAITGASSTAAASLVLGRAVLALTATSGFLYIPTTEGKPTGTPTSQTGTVPICFDVADSKLSVYSGGKWIQTAALA